MNTLTLRRACSIAYALHVTGMDAETREKFDFALNDDIHGSNAHAESVRARSANLGGPTVIREVRDG